MAKAYEYCGILFYIINEQGVRHHRKHVRVVAGGKAANYYIDTANFERDPNCATLEKKYEKKIRNILRSKEHRAALEAFWDNEQKDNPDIPRPVIPKAKYKQFS